MITSQLIQNHIKGITKNIKANTENIIKGNIKHIKSDTKNIKGITKNVIKGISVIYYILFIVRISTL